MASSQLLSYSLMCMAMFSIQIFKGFPCNSPVFLFDDIFFFNLLEFCFCIDFILLPTFVRTKTALFGTENYCSVYCCKLHVIVNCFLKYKMPAFQIYLPYSDPKLHEKTKKNFNTNYCLHSLNEKNFLHIFLCTYKKKYFV